MEIVSNVILSIGAVVLLSVGIYLALNDKTATAASVLTFASLFVALLLLAKFKRLKIVGILETEMWEEKQEEVAIILENFEEASARLSEVRDLIRSTIKSGGPPGNITPEKIQEPLLKLADAIDLAVRRKGRPNAGEGRG